jgi:16S rRNA (cytosine1407-C5)-methyltransferase
MSVRRNYEPKEKFVERMRELLSGDDDVERYFEVAKSVPLKSIRVNTLKIGVDELKSKLLGKGWEVRQPFSEYPEIMIIDGIEPGEIGKAREHLLGYYYVQEITSMMPVIALGLKKGERFLDLCASPGSKTTQAAMLMENEGSIIANDISLGRISILSANLQRCGVMNAVVTRHPGNELVRKLSKLGMGFDKILVDAPCSGEGNIRCSPRTYLEWSEKLLKSMSRRQKKIVSEVVGLLADSGEMVYSTCTHAPEENEEVVQYLLDEFDLEIVGVDLPLKVRPGLLYWRGKKFDESMKGAVRIYHHDNDMEGFFLCKLRRKGKV